MSGINRSDVFNKLNELTYKSFESATVLSKGRDHATVGLAHWVRQAIEIPDSDIKAIFRHFEVDDAALANEVIANLERYPHIGQGQFDFADELLLAVEAAWVFCTLKYNRHKIRTGHMLVGMLNKPDLAAALKRISLQFSRIDVESLTDNFADIVHDSRETILAADETASAGGGVVPGEASGAIAPAAMGKREALNKYSVDLTERARKGEIDKVVGRDEEIRKIVDILMRRRQNNPILTGEAGVGKTAVVEGFALRIAQGDVPPPLRDVSLHSLDIGLLQAGASMKGEFENRLRQVIEEVQSSPKPIIMFIDEAHTLIGAGGSAGTGDAANLLKPALARGTLRTIAATTWSEYKKYIEKDPALTRRFQVVQVTEPDEAKALQMMRAISSMLETHHRVLILDEAIEAAVKLSRRYIPARQLPDKAVSLLDTASARVAISLNANPGPIEDSQRRIESLEVELGIIEREQNIGVDTAERGPQVREALARERETLAGLESRWTAEKDLVDEIIGLRAELSGDGNVNGDDAAENGASGEDQPAPEPALHPESPERLAKLESLKIAQAKLDELQGENPLIHATVDASAVAGVVGDWTGIPVGRMVSNEVSAVLQLAERLGERVIGQDHALEMITSRIQTSRAGLENPEKPIGVFMLAGPSGVGKTETALALAEALYGGEQNLITINMSEFQEAHTVSTLKGAPPGYVGYGEGGVLTEAVRRRPYSVVLLDEVEKAHPDVHEIFFQVFDKGRMEDGEGRLIDFKNTLILLTSNVGSDLIANMCKDPELLPEPDGIAQALRPPLLEKFPAALLGRIVTIPYYPLSDEIMGRLIRMRLDRIVRRVEANHGVPLEYAPEVVSLVAERCTELESGGRMVDNILTNTLLPALSREFLTRIADGQALGKVSVSVENSEFRYEFA